jgi:hypothetical protein
VLVAVVLAQIERVRREVEGSHGVLPGSGWGREATPEPAGGKSSVQSARSISGWWLVPASRYS